MKNLVHCVSMVASLAGGIYSAYLLHAGVSLPKDAGGTAGVIGTMGSIVCGLIFLFVTDRALKSSQ